MPTVEVVTFLIEAQIYAIKLLSLDEIIPMVEIQKIPQGPSFLEGVINLRSEIVPVVNLERELGQSESVISFETRILIAKCHGQKIGFIVNGVRRVSALDDELIQPVAKSQEKSIISGIAQNETGQIIQIVTLEGVLTEERIRQFSKIDLRSHAN